jgi:hypothetical protein
MTRTIKLRVRRPGICGAIALAFCTQHLLCAGTFSLPLHSTNGWQLLHYRKIPPNTFRATPAGLEISVTNSAAPAVFPLTNRLQVSQLRVSGNIVGSLHIPPGKQGEKGYDDFAIRVGLVEPGSRTLSWREKLVSADWVKKLYALAPPGTGISRIHFFNVGLDQNQIGHSRTHPLSPLLQETIVAVPDASGHFAFISHFTPPATILAVWIASDGDDTKSSFAVTLNTVEFETLPTSVDK